MPSSTRLEQTVEPPHQTGRTWIRPAQRLLAIAILVIIGVAIFVAVRPQRVNVATRDLAEVHVALRPWIDGLDAPVAVAHAEDRSGRVYVVERAGRILIADSSGSLWNQPVLDIRDQVEISGEAGMLSMAFHPDFATQVAEQGQGRFYVTWMSHDQRLTLAEFVLSSETTSVEDPPRIVLEVPQDSFNHNGGDLAFGPEGYLYVSVGDGADPAKQGLDAQSLSSLLGKILRIDVDESGEQSQYGIPRDNPFISNGQPSEIYAMGLRNPWQISFDGGVLWAADVGGNSAEEIIIIQRGGNYGWPI